MIVNTPGTRREHRTTTLVMHFRGTLRKQLCFEHRRCLPAKPYSLIFPHTVYDTRALRSLISNHLFLSKLCAPIRRQITVRGTSHRVFVHSGCWSEES